MSVAEETQLREDQEAFDGATSLTPGMLKAAKRKCPSIPTILDISLLFLRWYITARRSLFTERCPHFVEVVRIRQELMLIFRRNMGLMSQNNISSLVWDIVADADHFFYTFPTADQFEILPPEDILTSNLGVKRSLFPVNMVIPASDTPKRWIIQLTPVLPP